MQNQHRYTYDALQRQTIDGLYTASALKWQVTTAYDGDRSWIISAAGGISTMTITNAHGKTTELRQYLSGNPPTASTFQATTYGYDRLDPTHLADRSGKKPMGHRLRPSGTHHHQNRPGLGQQHADL